MPSTWKKVHGDNQDFKTCTSCGHTATIKVVQCPGCPEFHCGPAHWNLPALTTGGHWSGCCLERHIASTHPPADPYPEQRTSPSSEEAAGSGGKESTAAVPELHQPVLRASRKSRAKPPFSGPSGAKITLEQWLELTPEAALQAAVHDLAEAIEESTVPDTQRQIEDAGVDTIETSSASGSVPLPLPTATTIRTIVFQPGGIRLPAGAPEPIAVDEIATDDPYNPDDDVQAETDDNIKPEPDPKSD